MFPDILDGAKVLFFSIKDDYGVMFDTEGNEIAQIKYFAICRYDDSDEYYLFKCNDEYEVESDFLCDSIEMCMNIASDSYGEKIIWVEKNKR